MSCWPNSMCWMPYAILCVSAKMSKVFLPVKWISFYSKTVSTKTVNSVQKKMSYVLDRFLFGCTSWRNSNVFAQKNPLWPVQSILVALPWHTCYVKLYLNLYCQYNKELFSYITCLFLGGIFKTAFTMFFSLTLRSKAIISS